MIDTASEHVLPLAKAARQLPRLRDDRPISPSTLWRWASAGLRGVRLETIKIGGSTCTSTQALARFFAALGSGPPTPAPRRRATHDDAVAAELTARGL
jgi:hypothetical protein